MVSGDAKRVFSELDREADPRRRNVQPIYVEGLSSARSVLNQELSKLSLGYAISILRVVGDDSGLNLAQVLAARFGEQPELLIDEDDIPF